MVSTIRISNATLSISSLLSLFINKRDLYPIRIEVTQVNNIKDLIIIRLQILNLNPNSPRDIESKPDILIQEFIEFVKDLEYDDILGITYLFDKNDNPIIIITTSL